MARVAAQGQGSTRKVTRAIAEAAMGPAMYADGTVSRADVGRFTHTAQSPTALGDAARHGTEKTTPPVRPMPFDEARTLINRILRIWLIP
jgi:hypothetical protein